MATPSSIKNRANIISNPMGQNRTNPESGESRIYTKDEIITRSECPAIILAPSRIPREKALAM
jgi:hypothetical protein